MISRGQKGYIGIGFSTRSVDLARLPGNNTPSFVQLLPSLVLTSSFSGQAGIPNHMAIMEMTARPSQQAAQDNHTVLNLEVVTL